MFTDYVMNGIGHGVGEALAGVQFDPNLLRPYIDENGRKAVKVRTGRMTKNAAGQRVPETQKVLVKDLVRRTDIDDTVLNAASLPKDAWINIDRAVVKATRQRLKAWTDLSASSSLGGFNGMGKLTHEYEAMSDPGEAQVDMDGLADGRTDNPLFKLRSVPLPITHSDFFFTKRRLAVSRNTGTPLDTTMAEAAGRRVAEMIEKTLIGVETGIQFGPTSSTDSRYDGTSKVYGYTNTPYRITKTDLTTPTGSNPEAVKQDIIEMRELMYSYGFYGPFMVYHTPSYDAFLDDDYFRSGGTSAVRTLRDRIGEIDNVAGVRRLDFWTTGGTYQMLMVQMTSDVAQAINAMDVTTVQWESQGGMRVNFKVMAIQVPLIKAPYNGVTGIVHATTS